MNRRLVGTMGALLLAAAASEVRHYLRKESLLSSEERLGVVVLDGSIEAVRERFNAGAGRWRLLISSSSMGPASVAGLKRIASVLLKPNPELPLEVSVVFLHRVPWDRGSKARVRREWSSEERLQAYWDPGALLSRELSRTSLTEDSSLERYLLFRPGQRWDPRGSPRAGSQHSGAAFGIRSERRRLREGAPGDRRSDSRLIRDPPTRPDDR